MARSWLALLLAAAIPAASPALAATTVVTAVLDRPYVFPGPTDRMPTFYTQFLGTPFAFNPGDTLDVTLTFPGGAALDLGFLPSQVLFTVFGGSGGTGTVYQSTGTLRFLNPTGAVAAATGPTTSTSDRNPSVTFTDVRDVRRGPLAFDGLNVQLHLDSAALPFGPPGPVPPATFSAFQVTFVNDVPEPATWLMLITGFGMAGIAARRRRVPA